MVPIFVIMPISFQLTPSGEYAYIMRCICSRTLQWQEHICKQRLFLLQLCSACGGRSLFPWRCWWQSEWASEQAGKTYLFSPHGQCGFKRCSARSLALRGRAAVACTCHPCFFAPIGQDLNLESRADGNPEHHGRYIHATASASCCSLRWDGGCGTACFV